DNSCGNDSATDPVGVEPRRPEPDRPIKRSGARIGSLSGPARPRTGPRTGTALRRDRTRPQEVLNIEVRCIHARVTRSTPPPSGNATPRRTRPNAVRVAPVPCCQCSLVVRDDEPSPRPGGPGPSALARFARPGTLRLRWRSYERTTFGRLDTP